MTDLPLVFDRPVTLVGGGTLDRSMLDAALAIAAGVVAADGAADRLAAWGVQPEAVIGDLDSISDADRWRASPARVVHLPEQESTDFEKCLYATEAPFYLGAGFTGNRIDHMLAVFHAMLRYPEKRVFLVGEIEAMALLPADRAVSLELLEDAVISLFPLLEVRGVASSGLRWPIERLAFAPGRQVGTSNRAARAGVSLTVDGPGMLLIVGRQHLGALVRGILAAQG